MERRDLDSRDPRTRRHLWPAPILCLVMGVLFLPGCASQPNPTLADQGPDPLAHVPTDFEVEVRVLVGRKVPDQDRLERRPAHIVLLPDGSLHAAAGEHVVDGARPGLARVLYRHQVADTWALLERLDFIDAGAPPTGPIRSPGSAEIVHVVEITADGKRNRIEKRIPPAGASSATTHLVRALGGLAWLRDEPPASSIVAPSRYDFGPDPWARYRK